MTLRSRAFFVISRIAYFLYSRFPVFGTLKGAVAIIRRDGGFVVTERGDGTGLGFPGGFAGFGENLEKTVRREVREETGLNLLTAEYKFDFFHPRPVPNQTYVFEATADGELRGSWEGAARVVPMAELERHIAPQQRRILEYLQSRS
ncbi:MAG TPA: NUDIX hydrolase [Terriglobales bacterium]|nr:NUDIX hydrolase [Terriglobales bacterium]